MKKQKLIVKFINKVDLPWGLSKEQLEELRKEVEQLTSENARLTEQLENSVQLPCKVGGVIYWVTKGNDFECREFYYIDEGIVEWVMVEEDGTYWIYVKYNSGLTYQHHIEKTTQEYNLYQSLSEAEARLKELKED